MIFLSVVRGDRRTDHKVALCTHGSTHLLHLTVDMLDYEVDGHHVSPT